MMWPVYSVFDSKVRAFLTPFFTHTDESAIRALSDVVEGSEGERHQFARHPEDFSLYRIGAFDDAAGVLEPLEVSVNLGVLATFRRSSQ